MSNLLENMKAMSREQLVALAISQGLSPHHKAKEETLIKLILDNTQKQEPVEFVKPEPKVAVYHTEEEVEEAIKSVKATKSDFKAEYVHEDGVSTVTFRYRGAEECHNMTTNLKTLRRRAEVVARGGRSLMGHSDFDRLNASGKNAYTNVVLA